MTDKIEPCPFCGSEGEIYSYKFGDCQPETSFRIQCKGQDQHSLDCWDDSREEAIQTWNTRSGITIPEDLKDEFKVFINDTVICYDAVHLRMGSDKQKELFKFLQKIVEENKCM